MSNSIADVDDMLRRAFTEPTMAEQEAKWREDPSDPRPILWQLREDSK